MTVKRYAWLLLFALAVSLLPGCGSRSRREVLFSYGTILRNEFIYNVGKVVPVTIEQTTEFDGVFSEDGLYLYYSSDRERGNFDIYLRSLSDITTVRITGHPAKDTSPAISPDGRRLAFVSRREDPEGDIYVMDVSPGEIIEKAVASPAGIPPLDAAAKNLTQYQDPVTKDIKIIRDASPSWSPDSRQVVFSSNRDGTDNIWMIDRDGRNLRQLTTKGGVYPRFSTDGKKAVFVSYRDEGSNGDIYILDILSGRETRVTTTPHIELYPSFTGQDNVIVYTLIDRDTNGDGKINLKDASVIMRKDLVTNLEYPLTLRSQSSFAPRWSGALRKVNERFHNVIIFSDQIGENININVIPEEGVIPLKNTAEYQHGLAQTYLSEYDDRERYLLGLEQVYHFFGDKKDSGSVIYVGKSLAEAGRSYYEAGNLRDAERVRGILSSVSKGKNDYGNVLAEYLHNVYSGRAGDSVLRGALGQMEKDGNKQEYLPFLMEDLGDEEKRLGRSGPAVEVYEKLREKFPKYKRSDYVDFKIATILYRAVGPVLPESYIRVINSNNVYLKIDAAKNIIKIFGDEKSSPKKIKSAGEILSRAGEKSDKEVSALMQYVLGEAYYAEGNYVRARQYAEKTLAEVGKTNFLFYKSNMLLGTIAERQGNREGMEKYYYDNVKNYLLRWKQDDFRDILTKLIYHYEDIGGRLEREKKKPQATAAYDKYINVVTTAHLLRKFEDIYNSFGSRAHVLYIDASSDSGANRKKLEALEKKYQERIAIARLNYDKAYLYGLAYVYAKLGVAADTPDGSGLKESLGFLRSSADQIDWALFMDDTYVEPFVLRGWISQYVDMRRRELGGENENLIGQFFPRLLWESNVPLYEKALAANDEAKNPEGEGNIHLNLANTYFLLSNYPAALRQYEKALHYKRGFDSPVQEALFRFHLGFCYWQDDRLSDAREEMRKTLLVYDALGQKDGAIRYREQIYTIYRYFALFDRMEGNWNEAITWYDRILDYTGKNRIRIDKARYYQEIAHCYRELGERDRALDYIAKADKELEGSSDEEKKYKLRFKVFGMGPVSFWDLGPDTAVIGDNRLFTELTTSSKKVLNYSMLEDIHFDKGDYGGAVKYLEKKLNIWKKRDNRINQIATTRALNNIGYCYYRMGQFNEALGYFKRAWDYAADSGVNDLEGVFNAILNYTNLYALLQERRSGALENPEEEMDSLTRRIAHYKDSYEKSKFEQDLADLKKDAEARKREVKPEEIEALKDEVAEEARNVYHHIDIAVGTLRFFQAERLLKHGGPTQGRDPGDRAFEVYRYNKKVYDTYAGAIDRFRDALEYADRTGNKRVTAKLLLNVASCQMRMGALDDAYETLSAAEDFAVDYAYDDVAWVVFYKTAGFLHEHGAAVEGAGHLRLAAEYYEKAVTIVEKCPQCFAGSAHLASNLYDDYSRFLIERGDWRGAFAAAEKRYAVNRTMMMAFTAPDFSGAADRDRFLKFNGEVRRVMEAGKKISSLLEAGEPSDSESVKSARGVLEERAVSLRAFASQLKKEDSFIASFLVVPDVAPRPVPGTAVFSFKEINGRIFAWSLGEKLGFEEITVKEGKTAEGSIREFLLGRCSGGPKECCVVLNETAEKMILPRDLKDYPPFTFVPSFERVRHYAGPGSGITGIYTSSKDLARRLRNDRSFAGVPVEEKAGSDLSKFSLIIDTGVSGHPLGAPALLGRKSAPGIFVGRMPSSDLNQIYMLAESSLYSGMKGMAVYNHLRDDEVVKLVGALKDGRLDSVHRNAGLAGVIPVGFSLERKK